MLRRRQWVWQFSTLFASSIFGAGLSATTREADVPAVPATDVKVNGGTLKGLKPKELETVKVTAQKRPENVQDVPIAVSAIGGDKIDSSQLESAGQITRYVPNTSASAVNGHGRPRWWIRGLGTGDQGANTVSPIGIYVDEVYLSNISAAGFPLFDLDRVEVLRGPQGTLWGKNTTGGAIAFVSRAPTFKQEGYVTAGLGNYGNRRLEGAYSNKLSDRVAARFSLYAQDRDGYARNEAAHGSRGDLTDLALRAQFLIDIADDWSGLLNLHYRNYHDTATYGINYGTSSGYIDQFGLVEKPSRHHTDQNVPSNSRTSQGGVDFTLHGKLGELDLTSISALEYFNNKSRGDFDGLPLELSRQRNYADSRQVSQELRLSSPRGDRINWVAGLYYLNENLGGKSAAAALDGSSIAPFYNRVDYHQRTENYSAFGNVTFDVSSAFSVTGGLRYTRESKSIQLQRLASQGVAVFDDPATWWQLTSVASPLVTTAVQNTDQTWSNWTYDFTPEYRFNDHARVYFRYAKGFRSGGFNTGVTTQASVSVVKPEKLVDYEAGFKSEWLDGRLHANASVFHYDYTNIQLNVVTAINGQTVSALTNGASGKVNGSELEFEALPLRQWRINLGIGLLHTRYTHYVSGGVDYSGNVFVRAPHRSATLGTTYQIDLPSGAGLELGSDWTVQSRQYFFSNIQTPNMRASGYALGNVHATYQFAGTRDLSATFYVHNVTNKSYPAHTLPGGYGTAGVYYGDPLTYGIDVTYRF